MMKSFLLGLMGLSLMAACAAPSAESNDTAARDADAVERVIMARRSIRQYTDRPISRDTLRNILTCGVNAPNGQNRQAYELRVVDDPKLLQEISDAVASDTEVRMRRGASTIFAGAPCVIFIARDITYDISAIDCGLLGENIILKACSMGIGTCCMAAPTRMMLQSKACAPYLDRLGFSANYELLYCIVMGYAAESPDAKPRKYDEKIRFIESGESQEISTLEPIAFEEKLQQTTDAVLIDVRKPDEYAAGHLSGAQLLNVLDAAAFDAGIAALDKSKHYFIYCHSGRRSHNAAVKMQAIGLKVTDLKGGITAWQSAGKNIVKE